ncbi:MAG: GNAT family N-acetyltransferase [Lachnospiraceae bacterium]|nr:GNAT family N-acetyltransferase [Lachnospiraceae bacterium]
MKIGITKNQTYVDAIVEIHMDAFTGFFLTFLGRGFLRTLYRGFMEHPKSGIIAAVEEGKVIGFCAYSEDLSGFYKYLIRRKLPEFAWYGLGAFVRKPNVLFRLLRAFTYPEKSERKKAYMELSSIGVSPEAENRGVGSRLVQTLCRITDAERFAYIKLETDREGNEGANHFYQKNGFVLYHSYETPEGRKMNEYRYDLRKKR